MADQGPGGGQAEQRPSKRAKAVVSERGPDLKADALFKYKIQLPQAFTPGSVQANRIALQVDGKRCIAYVANGQHTYEASLDLEAAVAAVTQEGTVGTGKEGVLVPRSVQLGHIRQLDPLSNMGAEVQGLYSGVHGGHHVLAAVDSAGNARLLATALGSDAAATAVEEEGSPVRHLMCLNAPSRGECGWTGLAVRSLCSSSFSSQLSPLTPQQHAAAAAAGSAAADVSTSSSSSGLPPLEVAVARQLMRDVSVYREGSLLRTLHTMQGPTALAYLPPGPFGGCGEASSGMLAIAEEHQISLWDVRQGERGGCVQRLGVYGG
ncbi:hypothetical protein Agub_g9803, partial [Astrephomene gubernaculifera]